MPSITVRSTIDLQNNASDVEVALAEGWANFSGGIISIKPEGGTMSTLVPKVAPGTRYSLGPAAQLISKGVRVILTGRVGDPNGATQGSFLVKCAFFQGDKPAGSSDAVSGQFPAGAALQDFNIICSFT